MKKLTFNFVIVFSISFKATISKAKRKKFNTNLINEKGRIFGRLSIT